MIFGAIEGAVDVVARIARGAARRAGLLPYLVRVALGRRAGESDGGRAREAGRRAAGVGVRAAGAGRAAGPVGGIGGRIAARGTGDAGGGAIGGGVCAGGAGVAYARGAVAARGAADAAAKDCGRGAVRAQAAAHVPAYTKRHSMHTLTDSPKRVVWGQLRPAADARRDGSQGGCAQQAGGR